MERKRKYVKRYGDKTSRLSVRLTPTELEQLETVARKTGKTKTDIIREGIQIKYNLAKNTSDFKY